MSRVPFNLSASARYIGNGNYNNRFNLPTATRPDIADNTIGSVTYLNLSGGYTWEVYGGKLELYGDVQNLLDRDPPIVPAQFDASLARQAARSTPGCSTCSAGASRSVCGSVTDAGGRRELPRPWPPLRCC